MLGEGKNQDYKVTFDVNSDQTKVDLVKNIVAIANSGGGRIIFGRDETRKPGVEKAAILALDSARLCDFTERYIAPSKIELAHQTTQLQNGQCH
ncbi:MAG: RNA-binding domain-containing protein [Chloroflexota bacterium]